MLFSEVNKRVNVKPVLSLVIVLALLQAAFWYGVRIPGENDTETVYWKGTRFIKPDLGIVPDLPSTAMVKAFSLGDEQLYFRYAAYQIQNAGDTFGRSTSLRDYDYSKLYKWWLLLDSLDEKSHFTPSMVSYYYGATPKEEGQIPYVVDYLEQHADRDPATKWWWYGQAIYHAKHKMNNTDRALIVARKLANLPEDIKMPLWTRQMQAFLLEDKGEYQEACEIILNIIDNYEDVPEGELNFMYHFIKERIRAMQRAPQGEIDPRCRALYTS